MQRKRIMRVKVMEQEIITAKMPKLYLNRNNTGFMSSITVTLIHKISQNLPLSTLPINTKKSLGNMYHFLLLFIVYLKISFH